MNNNALILLDVISIFNFVISSPVLQVFIFIIDWPREWSKVKINEKEKKGGHWYIYIQKKSCWKSEKKQNKTKQKEGIYHVLRIRLKPNVKNKAVLLASKRILVKYITT